MVAAKGNRKGVAKEQEPQPIMWSQEEVNYRDDLMQKIMTMDHVRAILITTGDSKIFIDQVEDLKAMLQATLREFLNAKQGAANVPTPPAAPTEPEGDEPSGDEGDGEGEDEG